MFSVDPNDEALNRLISAASKYSDHELNSAIDAVGRIVRAQEGTIRDLGITLKTCQRELRRSKNSMNECS